MARVVMLSLFLSLSLLLLALEAPPQARTHTDSLPPVFSSFRGENGERGMLIPRALILTNISLDVGGFGWWWVCALREYI